jgi:hypothetical protein
MASSIPPLASSRPSLLYGPGTGKVLVFDQIGVAVIDP